MSSPTQRSLALLRKRGGLCAIVEHWNSFCHRRVDLFGFADLLHVYADEVTLVQTTTGSNAAARKEKIKTECASAAQYWLSSPNRKIVVHSWLKRGARGERKLWTCVETEIQLADLV